MTITPYMLLDTKIKEMIDFYIEVLNIEIISCELLKEWPHAFQNGVPQEYETNIMNANITLNLSFLIPGKEVTNQSVTSDAPFILILNLQKKEETENLYYKLAEYGEIVTELNETPFSPAYGQVKDRFGTMWQLYTEPEESKEE